MNNQDRADSVDDQIKQFAQFTGLDLDPEADGPETGVADMICNLLHWCASKAGTEAALQAARNGIGNFALEHAAHPGEDPDGHAQVSMTIRGSGLDTSGATDVFSIVVPHWGEPEITGMVAVRAAFKVLHGQD